MLEGIDFPFSHDLNTLRNPLPDSRSVQIEDLDLAELTEWGVQAGYPGEWPELSAADVVRDAIAAGFRSRGLHADGETK